MSVDSTLILYEKKYVEHKKYYEYCHKKCIYYMETDKVKFKKYYKKMFYHKKKMTYYAAKLYKDNESYHNYPFHYNVPNINPLY